MGALIGGNKTAIPGGDDDVGDSGGEDDDDGDEQQGTESHPSVHRGLDCAKECRGSAEMSTGESAALKISTIF